MAKQGGGVAKQGVGGVEQGRPAGGELVWVELEHQGHLPRPADEFLLILSDARHEG